jgi:rhamnosyltransferase
MGNLVRGPEVSVVIPTFNGAAYLEEVLESVFSQKTGFAYEVIVIDSGSSDGTLDIVDRYRDRSPGLQMISIPNETFNHGGTRNLGAAKARGRFVAFLTQDATPADDKWLSNLRRCFDADSKVAAVFGKHLPRPDCNPITKRDIDGVFHNISPDDTIAVQEGPDALGFFSDVNSCLRKEYWENHPYPEIDYAEDQVFGRDVLLAGFKKVYCPGAAVYHSHNYPPKEFMGRYFDEYRGLNKAVGFREPTGFIGVLPAAIKGTRRDMRLAGTWYAWRMNLARAMGAFLGARHESLPKFVTGWLSLEERRKKAK